MNKEYWIPGRPATFATRHEVPWRDTIKRYIAGNKNIYHSVELEFFITKENIEKYAFDVDNLCEPVFAALASGMGWYSGKRSNIQSWKASKKEREISGLILKDVEGIEFEHAPEKLLFDGTYRGIFPNKATDFEIPIWLMSTKEMLRVDNKCSIRLLFGSKNLSIATISAGKVKPIIDCLFPILGGVAGAPDDHKITDLYVRKAVEGLTDDQVRISVWET